MTVLYADLEGYALQQREVFVEVPPLDRGKPPTSFKQRGRSRFHVDLLAPSARADFPVVPVPELGTHATGLPILAWLLAESRTAMLMSREGCCAVRIPLPERFAIHKLIVSRLHFLLPDHERAWEELSSTPRRT